MSRRLVDVLDEALKPYMSQDPIRRRRIAEAVAPQLAAEFLVRLDEGLNRLRGEPSS